MYDVYKNNEEKKFEVVAISIDTIKTDWQNFVSNNKLDWINISDLEGWYGQAANDYYIYATPTMFLIDEQGLLIKIIENVDELKSYFH